MFLSIFCIVRHFGLKHLPSTNKHELKRRQITLECDTLLVTSGNGNSQKQKGGVAFILYNEGGKTNQHHGADIVDRSLNDLLKR